MYVWGSITYGQCPFNAPRAPIPADLMRCVQADRRRNTPAGTLMSRIPDVLLKITLSRL